MTDDFDYGEKREDGQYENHPTIEEGETKQPVRHTYVHRDGCGEPTSMTDGLAKSYARDPTYYSQTFCVGCGDYFPVSEFVWEGTEQTIDEEG